MAWEYKTLPIPLTGSRFIYDAAGTGGVDGRGFPIARPIDVGAMLSGPTGNIRGIKVWIDAPAATAWLAKLGALLDDAETIRKADAVADIATDASAMLWLGAANARSLGYADAADYVSRAAATGLDPFLGFRHLYAIFEAIANVFNGLNIMWQNDAESRALYRAWLAGPPDPNDPSAGLYSLRRDYNLDWYHPNRQWPQGVNQTGELPAVSRRLFLQYAGADYAGTPSQFFQFVGLRTAYAPNDRRTRTASTEQGGGAQVDYAPNVINAPWGAGFATDEGMANRWSGRDVWDRTPGADAYIAELFNGAPFQFCKSEAGTACVGQWRARADWRNFWYGNGGHVAMPGKAYLVWARAWYLSLRNRQPEDIVVDSRAYVVQQNLGYADDQGGIASLVRQASGVEANVGNQQLVTDPVLQTIASTLPAIGSAIGSIVGPVGTAVGGIIGGAASLALRVVDTLTPAEVHGLYKDDLGRWKPVYERGWAGGNPAAVPIDAVRDQPKFTVPMPAGVTAPTPSGPTIYLTPGQIVGNLPASRNMPTGAAPNPAAILAALGLTPETWAAMSSALKLSKVQSAFATRTIPNTGLQATIEAVDSYAWGLTPHGSGVGSLLKVAIVGGLVYGSWRIFSRRN